MKRLLLSLLVIMLFAPLAEAKKERNIGDMRKFECYPGAWTITNIEKTKKIDINLRLNNTRCKHCREYLEDIKPYKFVYIETLQNDEKTIHLGVTEDKGKGARYVILEDYMTKEEIENAIK